MRLKQLKLAGFKSFANPTTFHFPKTITAIVGPNGCGKSNVIDAIRWVLGESSAKQLRGGAMSDVIFAGTQDKPAKSLASVELVFEHTQADADGKGGIHHPLNLYHELSVRRQINKEGKSDYFINRTKVRRRDVVDIFLGTGLGARSYAVIEQGMIGRIIDANALQLREFIEEASGVSRYQSRRDETQKQLATAQDNLARLQDMASELTSQQKRLAEQAKTAQQAQTWQQQLEAITHQLLIDDYVQAWQKQHSLAQTDQQLRDHLQQQQAVLDDWYAKQQAAQQQISEQQAAYQTQQHLVQRYWQQHHEAQSSLVQSEQRLSSDEQRLATLDAERGRLAVYVQQLTEQQTQAQAQIAGLPSELEQIHAQLNDLKTAQQSLTQQRQHIAQRLVQLNQQKTEQEKQRAVSDNAIKHYQSQQARLAKRQAEYQQGLAAWQTAQAEFEQQFAAIDEDDSAGQLALLADNIERLEARIIARQEALADQADEVEHLTRQHRQVEQQRQAWQTEQATLQNLLEQQQTQWLKSHPAGSDNLPKLLAQLQLTEQGKAYASIFDTLAQVFACWSVGESTHHNHNAIAHELGVFFSDLTTKAATKPAMMAEHAWQGVYDGELISMAELIATPNLPLFQQLWLVPPPQQTISKTTPNAMPEAVPNAAPNAMPNLSDLPCGHWVVYQADEQLILSNAQFALNLTRGLQQAKQTQPSAPLPQNFSHQVRIDELQQRLEKQQPQLERLTQALQLATVSLQECQAQDRNARNEFTASIQQQQQLSSANMQREHRYQTALAKLNQDKNRLETDATRLAEELTSIDENLAQQQATSQHLHQRLTELQPQLQQAISERQGIDSQLNRLTETHRQTEQQHNRLSQSLATGQLQIAASQQQLVKAAQDQQRLDLEHQQLSQTWQQQQQRLPHLREQVQQQHEQLTQANHRLDELASMLTQSEQQHQQTQTAVHAAQTQFANLQQQQHSSDTALALAQQNHHLIGEQLRERQIALPEVATLERLGKAMRKDLQTQVLTLKNHLSELGPVNHAAVAELASVNQRLEPLAEQIDDLTESIHKLQQAIKHIDSQTKALFLGMLDQVNIELNRLFTQVFGGGKAELMLTDAAATAGEAHWQAGLELMAQPKGKKNSRLALLSGGEKTLTALSLVFAIFKQQPAPFCVLDEVDAPLDDANVERFTNLIRELAKDVQFVFISHNKLSMQIADELKGVTMPTPGVSKLVSVDMVDVANYLAS